MKHATSFQSLLVGSLMMVVTSVVVAIACFYGPSVHLPLFVALLVGVAIGWMQPRKGWILALVQIFVTIGVYYLILQQGWLTPFDADATYFTVMFQFIPIFAGSYLMAFLKRAL